MAEGLRSSLFPDLMAELLNRGTSVRFRTSGGSMYPSIRDGELITVAPVRADDVKREDILLYRTQKGVIAHRVVEVSLSPTDAGQVARGSRRDARVFTLQGDASSSCDQLVAARQILGRVIGVERYGRTVALTSRGAKLRHRVRSWASRLKGWICCKAGPRFPLTGQASAKNASRCSRSTPVNQQGQK